jgi:cobalamin biosynthesis Mg chelatase CobN
MSRKLDRERSEANALRTLDERRAAQAAQERNKAARSAPGGSYADDRRAPPQGNGYGYGYGQAPAPAQPPVVVQRDGGGLGHIVAGAILARSMSNAHANNNNNGTNNNGSNSNGSNGSNNGGYYPAPSGSAGDLANQAGAGSVGEGTAAASAAPAPGQTQSVGKARAASVLGTIFWLFVLALVACGIWVFLKRRKARREADKSNYSFERN